jgi:hypothetical protein
MKSRFMRVGTDNSGQFEGAYMKALCEKIQAHIDVKDDNKEQHFTDKERLIQVQGVIIKILLNAEDYNNIKNRKEMREEEAANWIKRCVVGRVTKRDLDDERMKETNSLDLMQNSSIIYHTESILEM